MSLGDLNFVESVPVTTNSEQEAFLYAKILARSYCQGASYNRVLQKMVKTVALSTLTPTIPRPPDTHTDLNWGKGKRSP